MTQIISLRKLACENIRFSSLFAVGDVSRGGTSATQRQKFHTDDANQCLQNKSASHGVPNITLFNFTCMSCGRFWKSVVLCCVMTRNKFYYKVETLIPNITLLPINSLINELMNSFNYSINIQFIKYISACFDVRDKLLLA